VVLALDDGKFHVHEVLTGMESGEFVEILAGIREGDTVVTSAQFLIDSEASIAGSLNRLESVRPPVDQRSLDRVFVSGWVEDVDRESRRVRITHGPIDELGWPAMTMVFDAVPGLDLSAISAGQDVRFGLLQEGGGAYVLEHIFPGYDGGAELTEVDPGMDEIEPADTSAETERNIMGSGTVRGVKPEEGVLNLEHAPIPELDWPAMTMDFDVAEGVSLDGLVPGDEIHFGMRKVDAGGWVIQFIHVMASSDAGAEHDHD
jgi:Cu(I)/Ag(I) efflux system membrane fusion protein